MLHKVRHQQAETLPRPGPTKAHSACTCSKDPGLGTGQRQYRWVVLPASAVYAYTTHCRAVRCPQYPRWGWTGRCTLHHHPPCSRPAHSHRRPMLGPRNRHPPIRGPRGAALHPAGRATIRRSAGPSLHVPRSRWPAPVTYLDLGGDRSLERWNSIDQLLLRAVDAMDGPYHPSRPTRHSVRAHPGSRSEVSRRLSPHFNRGLRNR